MKRIVFLLLAFVGTRSAEANLKMPLVVTSCYNGDTTWSVTAAAGRVGRLKITDQATNVVLQQPSVHFATDQCYATLTATFTSAVLTRFFNPDDPLFITLESCNSSQTTCPFDATAKLDAHPLVFSVQPIDSVLPDLTRAQSDALEAERQARISGDDTELLRATGAESTENGRARSAETSLGTSLTTESGRATTAENGIQTSLNNEVTRATTAEGAEQQARQTGDQAERTYADGTFVKKSGDTVTGDLTINGVLRLKGGISWEQCPAGLNSLEHAFTAYQGTTNRLCASETITTPPSVQLDQLLASYIEPICPMVSRVAQNYAQIGGPAAINGINLLLGHLGPIITNQLVPLVTSTLQAGANSTNTVVDYLNNTIGVLNTAAAANVTAINSAIDAYNQLVVDMNGALTTGTGNLNGAIGSVNNGFSSVNTAIGVVVGGINLAVGDVNGGFAAINTALGSVSSTVNTLNSATNINSALSAFDSDINARIDALNLLVDGINSAQSGTVNGVNGAINGLNSGFATLNSNIGGVVGDVNSVIGHVNENVDATIFTVIDAANYVTDHAIADAQAGINDAIHAVNDEIIGPRNCATAGVTINGTLCFIDTVIDAINKIIGLGLFDVTVLHHTSWAPYADDISLGKSGTIGALTSPPVHVDGITYNGSAPSVGTLSAPSALGHLAYVQSHSIGSLGLPTLNLAITATMRTVSYNGSAPQVPTVTAPQITGANLTHVAAVGSIQPLPHVTAPGIPAFQGFTLVDAVDFNAVSGLISSTMSPICANLQGAAQSYLQAFVGSVPALVPSHSDAEDACGARGAHVCSEAEISILVGDDLPSTHDFGFGDWAGDRVILNDNAINGFMLATDWPFIKVDASKLMSFPPGFPFTFTPPVIPSGRFRCCASSTAFN
jgi:hypothetical protein